jgi:hypothetical protein
MRPKRLDNLLRTTCDVGEWFDEIEDLAIIKNSLLFDTIKTPTGVECIGNCLHY